MEHCLKVFALVLGAASVLFVILTLLLMWIFRSEEPSDREQAVKRGEQYHSGME